MRPASPRRARSLLWHLGVIAFGLIVPALAYVGVLLWNYASLERTRVEDEARALARTLSIAVDREISGVTTTLEALATSPSLRSGDLAAFYDQLQAVRERQHLHLSVRDADGTAILATRLPFGRTITAVTEEVRETDELARTTGLPQVSDVFMGPVSKAPNIQIVVPVLSDSGPRRVLGASVDPDYFRDLLARFGAPQNWRIAIVDRNNMFVSRLPGHDDYVNTPASGDFRTRATAASGVYYGQSTRDGGVLVGYWQSPEFGWKVAVSHPSAMLDEAVWRSVAVLAGAGLLLCLIAGALLHSVWSRLAESVNLLQRAAAHPEGIADPSTPVEEATAVLKALIDAAREGRKHEARLKLLAGSDVIGFLYGDTTGGVTYANNEFLRIIGRSREDLEAGRVRWDTITPPEWLGVDHASVREAQRDGRCSPYEKEYLRPDGSRVAVLVGFTLDGPDRTDAVAFILDISRQKALERQRDLLLGELNHRLKNTLATVQSIASLTLRTAPDMASFRTGFTDRLASLARTHTLLLEKSWEATDLRELLERETSPYATPGRVRLLGPRVSVPPDLTLSLALCIHELVTNACKHGALSTKEGAVTVEWSIIAPNRKLRLIWRERGGPLVAKPTRQGFGSKLLSRSLSARPGGSCELNFQPEGLEALMEADLDAPAEPMAGADTDPLPQSVPAA